VWGKGDTASFGGKEGGGASPMNSLTGEGFAKRKGSLGRGGGKRGGGRSHLWGRRGRGSLFLIMGWGREDEWSRVSSILRKWINLLKRRGGMLLIQGGGSGRPVRYTFIWRKVVGGVSFKKIIAAFFVKEKKKGRKGLLSS